MTRPQRASDFTLEFVAEALAKQGLLTDDARRTAFAREGPQRARLLREQASRSGGRGLKRAELSPVELIASFKFPDARRESELVDEDKAPQAVAQAVGIPYRKIDPLKLDGQLITRTLSRPFARKHAVLPLEKKNGALVVATANPFDRELFENLRGLTGQNIQLVLSAPADIHRAIAEVYGFRHQIREAQTQLSKGAPDVGNLEQFVNLTGLEALEASSEPIVAAVEYLLHYAFEQRASDIHVEPRREESIVRMRIDGVLHQVYQIPPHVLTAMTSRIKILARMDVVEKRRPQDGRLKTRTSDGEEIALTNRASWRLRRREFAKRFGFSQLRVLNDFEAIAWALPQLGAAQTRPLGKPVAARAGVKVVLGPGTGLGVAALLPADGRWHFVESLLSYWPAEFASVTLSDGRVLIAGGTLVESRVTSRNTEIFTR